MLDTRGDFARAGEHARRRSSFTSVANGATSGLTRERELLFQHRYALSPNVTPERFTVEGLRKAIAETIDLLASPAGLLVKSLVPRDPTGEFLAVVEQMRPAEGRAPRMASGCPTDGKRAVLIARTRASGSDIDASRAQWQRSSAGLRMPRARRQPGRQAAPHRSRRVLRALARDDRSRRRATRDRQHAHRRDDSVLSPIVRLRRSPSDSSPSSAAHSLASPPCRWDSARCTASRSDSARR